MAEAILFDVAGKILEEFGSLAIREIGLACGVKDEIKKLTRTVETIKLVLLDAEEQHGRMNSAVIEWIRRLKDAFYDADDLLDDFATELKQREVMIGNKMAKEVRIFFSKSNQIAYSFNMAHKIKAVREKLDGVKNDRQFQLVERRDEKRVMNIEREQTYSFVREEKVIGRDNDKKAIIKRLLESNDGENVSVIPIVGMGGLGKTTLAQLVYNDKEVEKHFQLRMWVCVSDDFILKIIVEKIIKSVTKKAPENLEMEQLQEYLRKEIDGKKYLLVLDDIWNEDPVRWAKLKDLLISGARGSKILITTRSQQVANITSKGSSYVLKGLSKDKSWSLFMQITSEHGLNLEDSRLITIGKEIIGKCAGVPLAINTIGHLLCSYKEEDDWLYFKDSELSKIAPETNDILPILKLSYDHLPSHLKQCFAYCALFPKDYGIEKEKLIYLWMAQGFLQSSNENQSSKDVGERYFSELLWGSFFQDPEYDKRGNIYICKMHDLMHDLACLVTGIECTRSTLDIKSIDERCRHVLLDCGEVDPSLKFPIALLKVKHIRTLLVLVQSGYVVEWDDWTKNLPRYKYLRALNVELLDFKKLPNSIGKLKHLRYLNLSYNYLIEELPNSISMLRNLETLDLFKCKSLRKLPRDTKKMVNLRHLILKGCYSLSGMPYGLGLLTNLQSLPLFVASRKNKNDGLEELNGLNNLRGGLKIKLFGHIKNASLANLERKEFLQFLILDWEQSEMNTSDQEVVLEGLKPHPNLKEISIKSFMGVKLSNWLSTLQNITSIHLSCCERCRHIPPLDQLASLKSLKLSYLYDLEYISDKASKSRSSTLSTPFFPSLQNLTLSNCRKLEGWWRRNDNDDNGATIEIIDLPSFPCLSKLEIYVCPKLTSMPLYPSLEELDLFNTSSKPLQQTLMSMTNVAPSTSSSFSFPLSKLKSMSLESIDDLESLPGEGLRNLTSLVYMKIDSCPRLSILFEDLNNNEDDNGMQTCSSTLSTAFFPSLQNLTLSTCRKLEGWWRRNDNDDNGAPIEMIDLPSFPYLSKLEIYVCPKLTSMPLYPSLEELDLFNTSSKPLQQTLMSMTNVAPSTSSSFSFPLSKLKSMSLRSIDDLESLPGEGLRNLTSLVYMKIHSCPRLSILFEDLNNNEDDNGMQTCSSTLSTAFFPSLQNLTLSTCRKLEGWWRRNNNDDNGAPIEMIDLPSFPCLSKLEIKYCPKLTSMPLYPSLEELDLQETSSKPLQQTLMSMTNVAPSTSSSFSFPLSKLKSMSLRSIDDLESLPGEGLRNLTSLVYMKIHSCPTLSLLSNDLYNNEDDVGMQWEGLRSLRSLDLYNLPKLVFLPKGLQFLTSLQVLEIWDCPNLTALPEGICHLTSLSSLDICNCPQLSERCGNNNGIDWPKIAHVPNIRIDQWIQREGTYQLSS